VITRRHVTIDILFRYQVVNYELFIFLLIFRYCLWALIFEVNKFYLKNSVGPTHQCQQLSIKKVIVARLRTIQQRRRGFTNPRR
jgi:hypothetical protein